MKDIWKISRLKSQILKLKHEVIVNYCSNLYTRKLTHYEESWRIYETSWPFILTAPLTTPNNHHQQPNGNTLQFISSRRARVSKTQSRWRWPTKPVAPRELLRTWNVLIGWIPLRPWKRLTPTKKLRIWRHWRLPCHFHCPAIRRQVCPLTSKNPRDAIEEITQHCDDHCDVFGSFDPFVSGDGDMFYNHWEATRSEHFACRISFRAWLVSIVTIMYRSVAPVITITIVYHLLFKYMLYYFISKIMLST